jgi:MFS superfamily sulfate permease-like transporter
MRPLSRASLLRDGLAGVELASMSIPQVLGYARIAGAPVVTGLYTLLLPPLTYAMVGSSRHLVVAADSATAAILRSGLSGLAEPGSARYVLMLGMVALLAAAMLLLARAFRLGFLADFLSRTVLVGFLAGVGLKVGLAMMGDMLGITASAPGTADQAAALYDHRSAVHPATVAISAGVLACLLVGRRWTPRVPVALGVVVAAIVLSAATSLGERGIALIGAVSAGLPPLRVPAISASDIVALLPIAGSCFVIIVAQSTAASRVFALRHHERVDADADIAGLAAANAAAAITGGFVVNGSLTQTAMGERAGAQSQFSQVAVACVVVAVLLFFTAWLQYLPRCVLATLVFSLAIGLIEVRTLADMRRESPGEFALAIGTAALVAWFGVEQGIIAAIALSLLRHVRQSYRPHTSVLAPGPSGRWEPVPARPGMQTEPGLIVYRFGADLFYANEHRFGDEVRALVASAPAAVRWLVIDAGAITAIDYSASRALLDACADLASKGVEVVFARVSVYLRADMQRHGIVDALGASRLVPTLHAALDMVHSGERQPPAAPA